MSRIEDFAIGFRILGVEPTTNFTEITKVFRKLIRKIHPDQCEKYDVVKNNECAFIFKIANEVYDLFQENKSYLEDIVREVRTIPEIEIIRLTKTYLESERGKPGRSIGADYIFTLPIILSLIGTRTSPPRTSPPRPTPGPATGRREEERVREEELRRRAMEEEERAREEAILRARREAEEERARRSSRPTGTTRSPPRAGPATGKREEEELRRKAEEEIEKAREEAIRRARREAEEERARRRTETKESPRRNERRYSEKLEELERLVIEIRNEIDKFYSRDTDLLDIRTKVKMVNNIFEIGSKITNLNELLSKYDELGLTIENPIVQRARDISLSSQGIVTERLNELENDIKKIEYLHLLYEPINLSIETNINEFDRLTIDRKLVYLNKIEERIEEKIREFQRGIHSKGYETIPLYRLMLEDLVSKLRLYQEKRDNFIRTRT